MAVSRWDPFVPWGDLLSIQNEMNRLFGRTYGRGTGTTVATDERPAAPAEVTEVPDGRATWAPPLDVFEAPDALRIVVELPGMTAAGVEITVDDEVLTLRGERMFYPDVSEEAFHRIERRFGPFQRRIALPKQSDTDRISASMEEGVLTIAVPKIEQAKPRRIEVKASET